MEQDDTHTAAQIRKAVLALNCICHQAAVGGVTVSVGVTHESLFTNGREVVCPNLTVKISRTTVKTL